MVQINNVSISNDGTEIYVDVQSSDRYGKIEKVILWDSKSFKNEERGIDISFKLVGLNNRETFTLTREEIEQDNFEGIWYIEFTGTPDESTECSECNNPQLVVLTNFNRVYRCIANELNKIDLCNLNIFDNQGSNCNPTQVDKILTMQLIIDAVKYNFALGNFIQGNEMYKNLNKLCKECFNFDIINTTICKDCS